MGIKIKNTTCISDALFTGTQRQVLGLLFGNPDRSYYLNEIVRFAGVGIGTVQREVEKLSGAGLLTVKKIGNQKHFQANRQAPIYEELRGIVLKTFDIGP
ncbi:MAG: winged helix-turn-helix transcriptional regulator [Desulfuromonadales bacterium]|nr:winged helix-turn-helix transcriptional regulator [Desulfuromonadales bacterium]